MKEKHCKISILVFAITTVLLVVFFMLTTSQAFADQGYKGKEKQKKVQKQKEKDAHSRRDFKEGPGYDNYSGYKKRPYDKRRHYEYYNHKGHRYDYHGHWRSWDQWDRYAKKHPDIYRHGTYYRENAHLMFRFCEPGTGNCFFFSIGR